MTVQELALVLGISPDRVRTLMEQGSLHEAMSDDALLRFIEERKRTREALQELTKLSQELGGYKEMERPVSPCGAQSSSTSQTQS